MVNRDRAIYVVKALPEGKGKQPLDLSSRVESFMYLDRSTKADRLEITIDNHDLKYFDDPVFRKGVILEVSWGYPGAMAQARRCKITGVKCNSDKSGVKLTVEALELSMLLHQVKKCRVWKNMSLQDIADKISYEYQTIAVFESVARDQLKEPEELAAASIQCIHVQQAAQTDAELLHKLARKHGLIFSVAQNGKITFEDPHLKKAPSRTVTWRGGAGDWETFSIENDITGLFGAVTAKGIDAKTKGRVASRADNDSTKREGLMQTVEVVDGKTGEKHYAQRAVAEQVEHTTTGEAGDTQVKAKAAGKFKASQRGTIRLHGTIIGDPLLAAKQVLQVGGLGKRVSGKYRLIQVRHEIANSGAYRTYFVSKSDGHGGYNDGNNVPSKAEENKEKPLDSGSEVEKIKVVNGITGERHYEFRSKRNKP